MTERKLQIAWQGQIASPVGLAWLADARCLLVCDPEGGRLASLDPESGGVSFLDIAGAPSFCFPTREGELLLGNGAELVRIDGGESSEGGSAPDLRIDMPGYLRTHFGTADQFGRLWFVAPDQRSGGSDGRVYRYHDGRMIPTLFDRSRPGGLALSADGRTLFHANGADRSIETYRVSRASALSERQVLTRFAEAKGEPRAIALDSDGHLWVAMSNARILRIAPRGEVVEEIALPDGPAADIAFGGNDYRTLFIGVPGRILSIKIEVAGLPTGAVKLSVGGLGLIDDDDH